MGLISRVSSRTYRGSQTLICSLLLHLGLGGAPSPGKPVTPPTEPLWSKLSLELVGTITMSKSSTVSVFWDQLFSLESSTTPPRIHDTSSEPTDPTITTKNT